MIRFIGNAHQKAVVKSALIFQNCQRNKIIINRVSHSNLFPPISFKQKFNLPKSKSFHIEADEFDQCFVIE